MFSNMFHPSRSSLVSTYIFVIGLSFCGCSPCELPPEIQSSGWTYTRPSYSPTTIQFGLQILTNFPINIYGQSYNAYTCMFSKTLSSDERILLFKSDAPFNDLINGVTNNRIYLCMKMTKVSSNLFYFYLLNDLLPIAMPQERASTRPDPVSISDDTLESFCQYDTDNPPDDVRTLQRSGTSEVLPGGTTLCEPWDNACETGPEITCGDIDPVPFSTNTKSGNSVGDTISFTCITGYGLAVGNAELTCSDDGTWTGTPPVCTSKLDLFCERLMKILYDESSEEENSSESREKDKNDRVSRRPLRGKRGNRGKGEKNRKDQGKKYGHCKQKLAKEILAQCE